MLLILMEVQGVFQKYLKPLFFGNPTNVMSLIHFRRKKGMRKDNIYKY